MAAKDKLTSLLAEQPQRPAIRRGQGVRLSTEAEPTPSQGQPPAQTHDRTTAPSHQGEKVVRVNRGYKLREDLIKDCKRLALETDRPLYEVMEAALSEYLQRHRPGGA